MKHIKLFEGFTSSANPVITATGDWSKLFLDGTPMDWLHANTYVVTYYTNPTPEMVRAASRYGMVEPQEAPDEIMGGDQGGSYIIKGDGVVALLADPSYSPEDYKKALQELIDQFNANPGSFEEDMCQSLLEDPEIAPGIQLTPEFLSHCKSVVAGSEMSQKYIGKYPQYYNKYPEIFPGGDRSGLKIMKPRISLIFKTV
jgi:hypothetical protein